MKDSLEMLKKARIEKNIAYDGRFYFGVTSTHIFCRPSCPSPTANESNVVYFETVEAAKQQGFRPCLRCQPENVNPESVEERIAEVLAYIHSLEGKVGDMSLLSNAVGQSERQMRKDFESRVGISPMQFVRFEKAQRAYQRIRATEDAFTRIAMDTGFESVRQFNTQMKRLFGMTPSALRQLKEDLYSALSMHFAIVRLYNDEDIFEFIRPRLIEGIEKLEHNCYERTFLTPLGQGYITAVYDTVTSTMRLHVHTNDMRCIPDVINRVKRMFDLDKPDIHDFRDDALLVKGLINGQVPRLPIAFDTFEFVIRAILGQQITVVAATTLAKRIAERAEVNTPSTFPIGLDRFFPSLEQMQALSLEGLGITTTRQLTLKRVLDALSAGDVMLSSTQDFDDFYHAMIPIEGIGDWTIQYIAMRGLGMWDAFPAMDLGVIRVLEQQLQKPLKRKAILDIAEAWKPYRAYATLCLWQCYKTLNAK